MAAAGSSTGAGERGSVGVGPNLRHRGSRSRTVQLYVTRNGQRYHCDINCHGLRNAYHVHRCPRCDTCGPVQTYPVEPLYGIEPGSCSHEELQHVQSLSQGGEIKKYQACAILRHLHACWLRQRMDLTPLEKGLGLSRC